MKHEIAHISLLVRDYDEALSFYTEKLGFRVIEDTPLHEGKRWVRIAPRGHQGTSILLARASNEEQLERVGNQTGGRVFLFLYTDDLWRDYKAFSANGVSFVREPQEQDYGIVAVFADLYGNLWDLIQPSLPS